MNFYMKSIPESIACNLVDIHTEGVPVNKAKYYKEVIVENNVSEDRKSIKSMYTFYSGKTLHEYRVEQLFKKRR